MMIRRRILQDQEGVAAVEMAIALPMPGVARLRLSPA